MEVRLVFQKVACRSYVNKIQAPNRRYASSEPEKLRVNGEPTPVHRSVLLITLFFQICQAIKLPAIVLNEGIFPNNQIFFIKMNQRTAFYAKFQTLIDF